MSLHSFDIADPRPLFAIYWQEVDSDGIKTKYGYMRSDSWDEAFKTAAEVGVCVQEMIHVVIDDVGEIYWEYQGPPVVLGTIRQCNSCFETTPISTTLDIQIWGDSMYLCTACLAEKGWVQTDTDAPSTPR